MIDKWEHQMRDKRERNSTKDPYRQILGAAVALLALGVALLVASIALALRPNLVPVGQAFRTAVPYVLLLGLGLLAVYGLLRRKPEEASRRPPEPTLFGKDSTQFPSQLDRGANEDPTIPPQYGQRRPPGRSG